MNKQRRKDLDAIIEAAKKTTGSTVNVTATGIVATDPRVTLVAGRADRASFRLSCITPDDEIIWFTVVLEGHLAARAWARQITPGTRVVVTGTLKLRSDAAVSAAIIITATDVAAVQAALPNTDRRADAA